jgi:hypothetical protein
MPDTTRVIAAATRASAECVPNFIESETIAADSPAYGLHLLQRIRFVRTCM